ncbi:MAG TPA: hypothetical protein VNZ65_00785 [Collimonas sp.]|nr:hypothetical protein [Collimonas sp.]
MTTAACIKVMKGNIGAAACLSVAAGVKAGVAAACLSKEACGW